MGTRRITRRLIHKFLKLGALPSWWLLAQLNPRYGPKQGVRITIGKS